MKITRPITDQATVSLHCLPAGAVFTWKQGDAAHGDRYMVLMGRSLLRGGETEITETSYVELETGRVNSHTCNHPVDVIRINASFIEKEEIDADSKQAGIGVSPARW